MKYRYLLTISLWSENGTIAWAHMLLCWYLRKSNASLVQVVQDQRSSGKKPDVLLIIFTQGRTIWVVKFSKYQLENMCVYIYILFLVGWATPPKNRTSSVGMMTFPIWWESHNPFHGSIIDLLHPIKMIERVNSNNMIWNHLFHYIPLKTPWYPIKIPWFQSPPTRNCTVSHSASCSEDAAKSAL